MTIHNATVDLRCITNLDTVALSVADDLEFKKNRFLFIRIKWATSDEYECYKSEKMEDVVNEFRFQINPHTTGFQQMKGYQFMQLISIKI